MKLLSVKIYMMDGRCVTYDTEQGSELSLVDYPHKVTVLNEAEGVQRVFATFLTRNIMGYETFEE